MKINMQSGEMQGLFQFSRANILHICEIVYSQLFDYIFKKEA